MSEAVTRAAALCDPDGSDWTVTALIESFEDDERPATAVDDLAEVLRSTVAGVDPEGDSPAAAAAAAAALWLATNMDAADDRERVLREGVRLFYADGVPAGVKEWLAEQDVSV